MKTSIHVRGLTESRMFLYRWIQHRQNSNGDICSTLRYNIGKIQMEISPLQVDTTQGKFTWRYFFYRWIQLMSNSNGDISMTPSKNEMILIN